MINESAQLTATVTQFSKGLQNKETKKRLDLWLVISKWAFDVDTSIEFELPTNI